MRLSEAAALGISRVRRPMWADAKAYAKIDLVGDGMMGPWLHLYDRGIQNAIGEATPQEMMCVGDTTDDYEEYTGEIDLADTADVPA